MARGDRRTAYRCGRSAARGRRYPYLAMIVPVLFTSSERMSAARERGRRASSLWLSGRLWTAIAVLSVLVWTARTIAG